LLFGETVAEKEQDTARVSRGLEAMPIGAAAEKIGLGVDAIPLRAQGLVALPPGNVDAIELLEVCALRVAKQRRSVPRMARFLARRLGACLLAACCVFACASGFLPVAFAQALRPVPAFDLESVDGTRFTSKALEGKVVLVDFWATWCQPCIEEIPRWNGLHTRYQGKGLVVVGMTIRSGWASDIKPDAEKLKIAYPVVVGNEDVEKGFGGIWGFPTTFLVNRKGQIYKKYTRTYPQKQVQIEADIQKLLAEKP
jgi:thiol-disulfide isomerase/thioredoxin